MKVKLVRLRMDPHKEMRTEGHERHEKIVWLGELYMKRIGWMNLSVCRKATVVLRSLFPATKKATS